MENEQAKGCPRGALGPRGSANEPELIDDLLTAIEQHLRGSGHSDSDGNRWFGLEFFELRQIAGVLRNYHRLLTVPREGEIVTDECIMSLEKRIADLEGQVQSQRVPVESIKEAINQTVRNPSHLELSLTLETDRLAEFLTLPNRQAMKQHSEQPEKDGE